jgi:DUF1680 family protein
MQKLLQTEFGGMNEVMADIYHQTGDERWLTVASLVASLVVDISHHLVHTAEFRL